MLSPTHADKSPEISPWGAPLTHILTSSAIFNLTLFSVKSTVIEY